MKTVTITYSRTYSEYRVPGADGREASAYYTDDEADAKDTARAVYGDRINLRIKRVTNH